MGKKIVISVIFIFLIATSLLSLVLMYGNDSKYSVQLDPDKISDIEIDLTDTWQVGLDNVIIKLTTNAVIAPSSPEALESVWIPGDKSSIFLNIKPGDIIEREFVYAEKKNTKYKASNRMRCISITWEDDSCHILFLDYSKLYIEARIPYAYMNYDLFSLPYAFSADNIVFNGNLTYLDYMVVDNTVLARFSYESEDVLLLPGTQVTLDTVLEKKENVVAVPTALVIVRGEDHFVRVLENGKEVKTVPVKIGAIGINNVEITSGISVNDILLIPSEEESLRYKLAHQEQGGHYGKN